MSKEPKLPPLAADTRVLDMRAMLRAGKEPFSAIMKTLESLKPGQGIAIRANFEPRPLFGVLAAKGFTGRTHHLGDDDWLADFQPGTPAPGRTPDPGAGHAESAAPDSGRYGEIDVRGLEPPEPLARVLVEVRNLREGATLKVIHERRPELLYPRLEEQGLLHSTKVLAENLVHIYITRPGIREG